MTWIKICGTTNLDDALLAIDAGADALGFVFAESTRRVTPAQVREIVRRLPATVEKIGVFVSESPSRIATIAEQAGLTAVQLHRPTNCQRLGELGVIPVLHMSEIEEFELKGGSLSFAQSIKAILLDSGSADKGGGTGKRFDWKRASRFLRSAKLADRFRIIIAGGLDPDNVGEAIHLFQPFGVDVVSGVELEKGKKDPEKVRAFIAAVRAADSQRSEIQTV